jgi:glycosyltransferase involved in cell wall biosynthesis
MAVMFIPPIGHENPDAAVPLRAVTPDPALLLSVVVPCYDEEDVLAELERRVVSVCERIAPGAYEIVLVNDGSRDRTAGIIAEMSARNGAIVGVDLARNYGHQIALTAGLSFARGKRILVFDADLQDPPELLDEMMARMDAGANVVYGRRIDRRGESRFKVRSAHFFYRLLDRLTDIEVPVDTGDFRLMDRKTLDVLQSMPEHYRFIRGMVAWIGMRQEEIPYERDERFAGGTKYPFRKMIGFAVDAITGFSLAPLRLAFFMALGFLLAAFLCMIYILAGYFFFDTVRGWAGILFLFLVFTSAQLICTAIIGEYVGRTYVQTKNRPLFVVKELLIRKAPPGPAR